jgi:spectinomycin phosphotransferase
VRIEHEVFEGPVAVKMATFLKTKRGEILKLVQRAEALAILIQNQVME